jgi:transcriptional regulator with XRE-family HTH domain
MVSTDQEYLVALGLAISIKRKKLQLTQADLAYKIGMEIPNLSVIENGRSNPQLLTLVKIASALNCQLKELLPVVEKLSEFIEAPAEYKPRKHDKTGGKL